MRRYIALLAVFLASLVPAEAQNPVSAAFPSAVVDDEDFPLAKNTASTTLGAALDSSSETITVASASVFRYPTLLIVDSEVIRACSGSSTTITVCSGGRGVLSTAASHSSGATIANRIVDYYLLRAQAEIEAIETALGAGLENVAEVAEANTFTATQTMGAGTHDLTTVDPSYPNILTGGLAIVHGESGTPNTTRQPSILLSRRDSGDWTAGQRGASFNFLVDGGNGPKELFTIEGRQEGGGNDVISLTARVVQGGGVADTNSAFALWVNADCFDDGGDCGGAEVNVINDSTVDAAATYFGAGDNRKYGLSIIGAPGSNGGDPTTPLAIGVQDANDPFQMGIEFSQSAIKAGAPGILLPSNIGLWSRNAANSANHLLVALNGSNDTIINAPSSQSILFRSNNASTVGSIDSSGVMDAIGGYEVNGSALGFSHLAGAASDAQLPAEVPLTDEANAFTATQTFNSGTSSAAVLSLGMSDLGATGQRDSHVLQWRGTSYDTGPHQTDWWQHVNIFSDAGASAFTWRWRRDGGAATTVGSMDEAGVLDMVGGYEVNSAPLNFSHIAGAATSLQIPSDVLFESEANTSALLRGLLSDETGAGEAVFAASPTLTGTVAVNSGAGSTLLYARAGSAQSGSVFEVQNSSGTAVMSVASDGATTLGGSGNTMTGPAGGLIIRGGTGAGDDITFQTTTNASKGSYIFSEITSAGCATLSASGVLTSTGTACGSGGGGGGSGGSNYSESFTSQTSVVLDHSFDHNRLVVSCYDGSSVELIPATTTIAGSSPYAVTVTFSTAQTGHCVVSGGGSGVYNHAISASTSATVLASSHQLGTEATLASCVDNGSPESWVLPSNWTRNASGDIVITFSTAFTGTCQLISGGGSVDQAAHKKQFIAGSCQNATAALAFNTNASGPSAACVTGSNTVYAEALFDAGTDEYVIDRFQLPAASTVSLDIRWRAAATSGDVVWALETACVADAETGDPSWNTAQTVTDTAKGTTLQWNDASLSNVTLTGCAINEELFFRFRRDADNGSDTMTGDAGLISLRFTIQ